ncbi:hypothetical protein [Nocardia sp. XZ_19_385]|uniref:hypothetical protein n=1 Tax=Nocardia sp. XZ_19_385 TaxID=2769488 RepID=UPI0030D770AB
MIWTAVRLLPADARQRSYDEWHGELDELKRRHADVLAPAARNLRGAPLVSWTLRVAARNRDFLMSAEAVADERRAWLALMMSDLAIIATVLWVLTGALDGTEIGYWEPQVLMVTAGLALTGLRLVLLAGGTGVAPAGLVRLGIATRQCANWLARLVSDKLPKWVVPSRLRAWLDTAPLAITRWLLVLSARRPHAPWYGLLGIGLVAHLLLVAGSGGIASSPFASILIGSVTLSQFRSPTRLSIVCFSFLGLLACAASQLGAIWLYTHHPSEIIAVDYSAADYLAPLAVFVVMNLLWNLSSRVRTEAAQQDGP